MRVGFALRARVDVTVPRVARRVGVAVLLLGLGPLAAVSSALADDSRTLRLHNIHTHEDLTITFKKDGRYDEAALKRLNAFMRDWREEREIRMDPQLYDMLWEVHREVKATGPIHVVCGYRSPETNAMLRRRSRGVARTSLHTQGKAIDFSIPSANVADVRAAALRVQGGGVGYYPTSGIPFVHMDVGNVRHWPRMTREQLAKIFPDGRTVHVPSDGNPLPGYELALADIERGNRQPAQPRQRSLIASLFGGAQDAEEVGDNDAASRTTAQARRPAATPSTPSPPTAAATTRVAAAAPPPEVNIPLPRTRPTYQVAALESRPVPAPAPRAAAAPMNIAALSPNDIVNMRGLWQGLPETQPELPAMRADASMPDMTAARRLLASSLVAAGRDVTAAIGPFAAADRVPADVALAYAAQAGSAERFARAAQSQPRINAAPAATVTTTGSASVAAKPPTIVASGHRSVTAERLNDPWLRGLVMAQSVHHSLIVTVHGDPDYRTLSPYLLQPDSAVMMTFSHDPHLGMTAEAFTGSAIVFQATITFGRERLAELNAAVLIRGQ